MYVLWRIAPDVKSASGKSAVRLLPSETGKWRLTALCVMAAGFVQMYVIE
jgi:hypothetical protein